MLINGSFEEYDAFKDNIINTRVEKWYSRNLEEIEMAYLIGESIVEYYKVKPPMNNDFEMLSKDVNIKPEELEYYFNFAMKFPDLESAMNTFKEGKKVTWNKVKRNYLDNKDTKVKKEKKIKICSRCGAEVH